MHRALSSTPPHTFNGRKPAGITSPPRMMVHVARIYVDGIEENSVEQTGTIVTIGPGDGGGGFVQSA